MHDLLDITSDFSTKKNSCSGNKEYPEFGKDLA